ncbi:MAG TPA: TIGR04013 family B12-binding domain/radical SAM domain-containing protein [Methanosarcinaceae archaeon]|nr:TIGR04013 family B12-binding domain/radical SAM domain-containing protein [Methanosarcinaceae archaeon]
MNTYFRWNKKNSYSLAALAPLVPEASLAKQPQDGIMLYSFVTKQAGSVFEEVNRSTTDSIFIAGGPHPSGAPRETLEYFDYVVIGEGEETLPCLIRALKTGGDIGHVKGIASKDSSGRIVQTGKREHVDLNNYPCFDPKVLLSPIEISRGCPWSCKYCQTPRLFGRKVRHRSVDSIVKCAKHYSDLRFTSSNAFAYGGDGVHPRFDKVEKLLSTLHKMEGKKIYFGTFPSEVRPEFITDEALEMIERYCTNKTLSLGAQSGSERMLKEMWRGHTVDDVIVAVERCTSHGITPNVDLIFGYPDETEQDQQDSLKLIKWISGKGGSVRAHYLTPLPDTPYADVIPSKISDAIKRTLGRMALDGNVTGVWE